MSRERMQKKTWVRPHLRSERVQETLARPACQFKPPGQGGFNPGQNQGSRPIGGGWGPAFS